jgi:hypothetical protein
LATLLRANKRASTAMVVAMIAVCTSIKLNIVCSLSWLGLTLDLKNFFLSSHVGV